MKNAYSLYIKTHVRTGLKYLGQTAKNPFKYPGSGVDWSAHLKEFGNDVVTEIIIVTNDREELCRIGRYYSTLWRIVSACDDFGNRIWANRIPETGGGSVESAATSWKNTEIRKKRIDGMRNAWANMTNDDRVIRVNKVTDSLNTQQSKERLQKGRTTAKARAQLALLISDTAIKEKRDQALKKMWNDGSHKAACLRTTENPAYNHEIFEFINKNGLLLKCTMYELCEKYNLNRGNLSSVVNNVRKSCGGWSLKVKQNA